MKVTLKQLIGIGAVVIALSALGLYLKGKATVANHAEETHEHHEQDHEEHSEHDGHEEGGEIVHFTDAELNEFGIEVAVAEGGSLDQYKDLPGEIVFNSDNLAHVVPRVTGVVRKVLKSVGDSARTGELLAVLESRELAEVKADYLAAVEREKLALATFEREKRLWHGKVTSEQEYLDARQALAEAVIARNAAEQQLQTLGFSEDELNELPRHRGDAFTRFEIRAPISGTVIERHLTLGEGVKDDAEIFTIADLSSVWVDINVYQKDLVDIREGQAVWIETGHGMPTVSGTIAWVSPLVDESTRTAKARVVLPNLQGSLRPGLFITARVAVGSDTAQVIVPRTALQTFEGHIVVFVQTRDGFIPQPVEIGKSNSSYSEIVKGLAAGTVYVSKGSFTLKAELSKAAFGDGHNH